MLYVDDILLIGNNIGLLSDVKEMASRKVSNERFGTSELCTRDPNHKGSQEQTPGTVSSILY